MFLELTFLGVAAYQGAAKLVRQWRQPPPARAGSPEPRTGYLEPDHDHRFTVSSVNLGVSAAAVAFPALTPLAAGGVLYVSAPVVKRAVTGVVRHGTIGNDLLVTLSMVMFFSTGYIGAMAIGSWFYFLGSRIQRRVRADAQLKLSALFRQAPPVVWILREGSEVSIPLDHVEAGDIVVVRAGEIIPIDGVIVDGQALIDQHLLTGESQPAEKDRGDRVLASTVVLAGTLHIEAEQTGLQTTTAKIASMLEHAVDHKSTIQLKGERLADQVALPLLATAGAALVLFGPVPSGVVLSSGIGNRMRLLGPLGTLTYLNLASQYGFLVKDGRALEQLRSVDTLLFDKTGTLTKNELIVSRVVACRPLCEHEVLRDAAIAEQRQSHPIARTIRGRAAELGIAVPEVDPGRYQIGYGISVGHEGRTIQVGSAAFLRREGIALEPLCDVEAQAHEQGHALVFVARDGVVVGAIELEAALRPGLAPMLATLRRHGITMTAVVSGDHDMPTRALAGALGVDRHYSGMSPACKAEIVESLQQDGRRVCFIGDGVNDSVAMKKADVSMSLHGASSFATDAAQIVLMDADAGLANLGRLFELAQALDVNLRNSLRITLAFAALNVNGALFIENYGVLTAFSIKKVGMAVGLGNAMLAPRARSGGRAETKDLRPAR